MAKKSVIKNQNKGCLWWFGAIVLACLLLTLLVYGLCIAAGIGLWFLIRYIWRRAVVEMPDSSIVQLGLKLKPIQRQCFAGLICALVSLQLIAAVGAAGEASEPSSSQDAEPVAQEQVEDGEEGDEKPEAKDLKVTFIDVGQGDSELIELPDGKTMLIDAGEASASAEVIDTLKEAGVDEIDYLVGSHPHSDHIGGMEAVLSAFEVKSVWAPDAPDATQTYEGFLDAVDAKGLTIDEAKVGKTIATGKSSYSIELLAPSGEVESEDMNDYSSIVRVEYGEISFLFTGDASSEDIVAASPGHVDVLKAAHHGSETGTDPSVISETTPSFVIMSYSEGNSYGHPDQAVLDSISAADGTVYSTASNGRVTAISDGETVSISAEREGTVTAGLSAAEREAQVQAEREARALAEQQAQQQMQAEQQTQQVQPEMVVITPTGEKYHRPGCRTLNRSKTLTEVTKDQAIANGLGACGVCNP